ncbi:hypothetical protein [Hymenobacter wooponensis]|uniref:Uncharacterized protein n=1 Tax=Hymenobacter wooponensis TaxID=1525360 RepID=A0A4Z0MEQ3_9BACT|nr:hypothetical protein [Hymenobacter wooponensis]TGD78233.1 hypothetical protein EU557_19160 [Hymenobacter wooponensis]
MAKQSVSSMTKKVPDAAVFTAIHEELARARLKFPNPQGSMTALTEEVGELAKALLDESWDRVVKEAIQVAVMAIRVATEGDPTLDEYRRQSRNSPD